MTDNQKLKNLEATLWATFNDLSNQARFAVQSGDIEKARDLISTADGVQLARKIVFSLIR